MIKNDKNVLKQQIYKKNLYVYIQYVFVIKLLDTCLSFILAVFIDVLMGFRMVIHDDIYVEDVQKFI